MPEVKFGKRNSEKTYAPEAVLRKEVESNERLRGEEEAAAVKLAVWKWILTLNIAAIFVCCVAAVFWWWFILVTAVLALIFYFSCLKALNLFAKSRGIEKK